MPVKYTYKQNQIDIQKARLEKIAEPDFTKALAKELGEIIVSAMKELISKGISPIKGGGRYKGYKGGYKEKISAGKYAGKGLKPVNLYLKGDQMNSLKANKTSVDKDKIKLEIGYGTNQKSWLKEKGHREGYNGQEKRPSIPEGNEEFSSVIRQKVRQRVADFLLKSLKKKG